MTNGLGDGGIMQVASGHGQHVLVCGVIQKTRIYRIMQAGTKWNKIFNFI